MAEPEENGRDADNVAQWRDAQRFRLLQMRADLPVADRVAASEAVAVHLDRLLAQRCGDLSGLTISAWWPIKAELNLRHWMERQITKGAQVALPVVVTRAAPLIFRPWTPDCRMVQGFWKIPVPADGPDVDPDIVLAPLVGWDDAGYRLGYGGGYFDRTLATFALRPIVIGVGLAAAHLPTIFPQPHDIAMDEIVTEGGA
ncbi:MAG: 5-formyltetrahydrofolate cyclo-ligase [Pseudotabrizicola sp.]|uniref:5-formyltetrahydrofolate cyclo-ligase n=1 Tax=Pseudotabrizicola sp. TaxID=2939647 RepID=UPI0027158E4E|nr:5-formyltetrahydrofolate cyclo-ligase [Pseudotabrizicola sp.]MDO9638885.1 5-formyltetrahydrofolate cyclo-ligase [Pseudotabrizicola sp.]